MGESLENRRAGRESELRKKIKETMDRYESVFAKPLSTVVLKSYLDHCEEKNQFGFLTDRLGVLSDIDIKYLRNVLKEHHVVDESPSDGIDLGELGDVGDEDESEN